MEGNGKASSEDRNEDFGFVLRSREVVKQKSGEDSALSDADSERVSLSSASGITMRQNQNGDSPALTQTTNRDEIDNVDNADRKSNVNEQESESDITKDVTSVARHMKTLAVRSEVSVNKASSIRTDTAAKSGKDKESQLKMSGQPQGQSEIQLPQKFSVKYLGKRDAKGLWGIKHTRKPVDEMVSGARNLKPGISLPFLELCVSDKGVTVTETPQNINKNFEGGHYNIDTISYGVQDLVYTRVFAMIVVREVTNVRDQHPFECHAYVCDTRHSARRLTFALATAFQQFSKSVKDKHRKKPKKFAIDLRTPEEIEAEMQSSQEQDSEA